MEIDPVYRFLSSLLHLICIAFDVTYTISKRALYFYLLQFTIIISLTLSLSASSPLSTSISHHTLSLPHYFPPELDAMEASRLDPSLAVALYFRNR
jgi:hypothetical protein